MTAVNFDKRVGSAGYPAAAEGQCFNINNRIDFSTGLTGLKATDTVKLLDIPAGCSMVNAYAKVITPCDTGMTMIVGDASDDNGWITSLALNGAADTITAGAGAYLAAGEKFFSADTPLVGVIGGTADESGIVEIVACVRRIFPD